MLHIMNRLAIGLICTLFAFSLSLVLGALDVLNLSVGGLRSTS